MDNRKNILKRTLVIILAIFISNIHVSMAADKSSARKDVSKLKSSHLSSYKMGAGDMLDIEVWKEEGLRKTVLVRPDGGITFPLAGEFMVGGKTPSQLQKMIVKKLKKYIPSPVVTVSVVGVENNHIYVIGKVNRPADFSSKSNINVMQALTTAGGLNAFAKSSEIKILRRINGKQIAIPFDYDAVSQGEGLQQNITLKNGDVVVVP